jgi:hypothetical protein
LRKNIKKLADKLPKELRANYESSAYKGSVAVECLKVAAALKLWDNRGYRDIKFEVPLTFKGKRLFIKVLARDMKGMVGVECAPDVRLEQLRRRVAQLRACLPPDSYLIIIFPSNAGEHADRAVKLAEEVWVTGKGNLKVARMMFTSIFGGKLE